MLGPFWRKAIFVVCIGVMIALGCQDSVPEFPRHEAWRAKELFGVVTRGDCGMETRLDAAERLARAPGADCWLIVLLQEPLPNRDPWGRPLALKHIVDMEARQRPLVAVLLMNMSPSCSDAVLWAVSSRLGDSETAMYGRLHPSSVIPGLYEHETHVSPPIRDLARDLLKRALGVDHGYEADAWRREILARSNAG